MRYACVTGADRGIGLHLVKQLLAEGYQVFAGKFLQENHELDGLKAAHREALHIVELNVTDGESVKATVRSINEKTDRLELLINNAAILGDIQATIEDEMDFAQMEEVFRVNAIGSLRMSNALYPYLEAGEMKLIVNISSEAGSIGDSSRESWYAYCMSKSALNMQSALIHNHIRKKGGQVMVVHPGWVQTYMQGKLDTQGELTPEQSAIAICARIAEHSKYIGDKPAYLDYSGAALPW
ncbi:SDR family oxidoreductase [Gorillibacterium massiliense]|uniref:SDR family oxidoreductase n=1 Tax=Gorillibacterium massiliense TaxID=1280390 RepID=UPI0004B4DE7A|nr:SDR family oxidoreductase [Gorillibacterium massiliense]